MQSFSKCALFDCSFMPVIHVVGALWPVEFRYIWFFKLSLFLAVMVVLLYTLFLLLISALDLGCVCVICGVSLLSKLHLNGSLLTCGD